MKCEECREKQEHIDALEKAIQGAGFSPGQSYVDALYDLINEYQTLKERRTSWVRRISSFLNAARAWRREWAKRPTHLIDPDKDPFQNLETALANALEDFEMAVEGNSHSTPGLTPDCRVQGNPSPPSHLSSNRVDDILAVTEEYGKRPESSKGGSDA